MKRLLVKELLEMRQAIGVLLACVALLLLLGDPLSFRQEPLAMSGWIFWPMAVAFLMGLGAYSRELAGGTLPFALSRPIGVTRLAASKILSGLLVILAVSAFAAVLYWSVMPGLYRPHVGAEVLANGAATLAMMLGTCWLAGFAGSMLAPGLGPALAAGVAAIAGIAYVLDEIAHLSTEDVPVVIALCGVALAALLAVTYRSLLSPRLRLGRWFGAVGASLLIAAACAYVSSVGANSRPPYGYGPLYSPDRARSVYVPDADADGTSPVPLFLSIGEETFRRLDQGARLQVLGWTPDSRTVLYAVQDGRGAIRLRSAALDQGWTPRTIVSFSPSRSREAGLLFGVSLRDVVFSPSGRRVAVRLASPEGKGQDVVAVDLDAGRGQGISAIDGAVRMWWRDDRRLVLLSDGTPQVLAP